ncbi:lysophospholipid acyltransferase family protein [uncultured Cetobacterium sp.]|uniref:lysophospholipid acyltransferase family protein n=1 Tax=uncultured Cetobacterium sp. TaxID=527638 RepID=UPI00262FE5A4|nr:lysophospholipid acyltransferase family protein [uncultured Cetobacterium sp.]
MYKLQYIIFKFFRWLLLLFPEKTRFKFAEVLAVLGYRLIKKRRIIALANLELAFPEKSEKDRERIALESYKIMSKAFLSTLWFDEYLKNNVHIEDMDRIEKIKERGQGLAIALIHMGNMEAHLKATERYKVVTVAKAQRNPYIDKFITKSREKLNLVLIKKSKQTSRELLEQIEEKNIIALFSDHRDKGASVEFFGTETVSPTGIINIALKHNMPLVIGYNIMNRDNTSTTYFTDEIELERTDSFKDDVKNNTQMLISRMERIIINYPNQWMWFHDRWKLYKKIVKK